MNTQQLLNPVSNALTHVPSMGSLLRWTAALGLLGRRRSRFSARAGLIGGGAMLAAAGVFLFTTQRGRALRTRLGKKAGASLGSQVGGVLGAQAGGHPIRSARVVEKARRLVGSE